VAIDFAETNLVALPDAVDDGTAASLGCRFATSFRALVDQAKLKSGEWIAVHGCGGVGLSAIMIAAALGANPVAIDLSDEKLALARECGAVATINASGTNSVVEAVRDITGGGAHVSIDALGHQSTCFNSIQNLRRRGRHVQVGLMLGDQSAPRVPMAQVIAHELEIYGSHGMQAWRYEAILAMIETGRISPGKLIGRRISLEDGIEALTTMDKPGAPGMSVITEFG
jgi:alcohol dehydrogenase